MGRRGGRRRRRRDATTDQRLDPSTATIAIIGSGLAGLSTALCLQQAGFQNICVFERDVSLDARKEGYGMTLTYNPAGILGAPCLGVLEALAAADCPSRAHYLLQAPAGHVLGYFGNAFSTGRGVGQRGNLRVPRQVVRRILLDKLLLQASPQQDDNGTTTTAMTTSVVLKWNYTLENVQILDTEANMNGNEIDKQSTNSTTTTTTSPRGPVALHFSNGEVAYADLVVAADGWKSPTLQCALLQHSQQPQHTIPQPRSLGIYIIVGLAQGVDHALVRESGFYTLGPGQRLFVMPFAGTALDQDVSQRQTMWQLSFAQKPTAGRKNNDDNGDDDCHSYVRTPQEYWQQAHGIMQDWHAPVPQLLEATPLSTVWGTLLHDRDPWAIWNALQQHPRQQESSSTLSSRLLVVGDALHAMSPFKGQGANQSLADGAVVASWLTRPARRSAAVQGAMREIVQRTAPVVQASRQAALYWHSPEAWTSAEHAFAGLSSGTGDDQIPIQELQLSLREANITASTVDDLDAAIRGFVQTRYPKAMTTPVEAPPTISTDIAATALHAAQQGDLETLRLLTWQRHYRLVQCVVDPDSGNSCLHQALLPSDVDVSIEEYWSRRRRLVTWLVTEAGCDLEQCNRREQRPVDVAIEYMIEKGNGTESIPKWWHRLCVVWQERAKAAQAALSCA